MTPTVYVFFDEDELHVCPDPVIARKGSAPTIQWKTLQSQPQARIDTITIEVPWPYQQPQPSIPSRVKTVVDRNETAFEYKYTITASLGGETKTLDPQIVNEGEANGADIPPKP